MCFWYSLVGGTVVKWHSNHGSEYKESIFSQWIEVISASKNYSDFYPQTLDHLIIIIKETK